MSGRVVQAPSGAPLPMPLAIVTMSGVTPQFSNAQNFVPVRPNPPCTSSAAHSPPCLRTMSYTILKYSGGGVTTPPTPCKHSPMNSATSPLVSYLISSSVSRAHFTSHEGYVKPNG